MLSLRDQALVAGRKSDRVWIKSHKSGLGVLGPWERRAILFGASALSRDEMNNWLGVAGARGDMVERAMRGFNPGVIMLNGWTAAGWFSTDRRQLIKEHPHEDNFEGGNAGPGAGLSDHPVPYGLNDLSGSQTPNESLQAAQARSSSQ